METDEIQKEIVIEDGALGNDDISSSVDVSLEDPHPS